MQEKAKRDIAVYARALGFASVGFSSATLTQTAQAGLTAFLEAGFHGTMGWMAERSDQRADPKVLWPETGTVIALGMSYAPVENPLANLDRPQIGNISVYARNRDYHDIIKGKLKQIAQRIVSRHGGMVKVFVDTAPVMEKPLARQAGLGWQGKHSNLVSRQHGSWLLLGEIFTTLVLPEDDPHPDRCGSCRRCLDACPTNAFPAPYRLDATRCVSYYTIEFHGPVPEPFRRAMGNRIYGCDDCLAVCPWNRFAAQASEAKLKARPELVSPQLDQLVQLDDAGFRLLFSGSPVKRIGRDRFIRNVLYAIGNSGDSSLLPKAQALTDDASAIVADAARWAVARLAEAQSPS
ncbi:tRNA epoxyqueuosine(34) reductase QueG [Granulibacter bethesdensis]|uniref:tRNA epoxyqueuosine(34) reductase QueG n=1 Tax=Granulibacter bethesdensis TaxID=364410 RepID=UPI0009347750|nr:tRNA epoxyqueuosine(34) reductase QueG [Granulibacter bethesdensis]